MEPERIEVSPPHRPVFSREQKVGYAVVIGCGVLAVALGFVYMGTHLNAPFKITYEGSRILTNEQRDDEKIALQKQSDTDGDTVSDYDEIYVYRSSPYLNDTDSDGLLDNAEINGGSDPACATGDTCENDADDINLGAPVLGDYADQAAKDAADAEAIIAQVKASLTTATPAEIRLMLIESGAAETEVAAMTDEEVSALYTQIISQLEASGALDAMLSGEASSTVTP